ncbi:dienelactone hydrolase family protein [Duganella sp. sic0402]|uniref:dienelactone hydrolase family protein n=1 Tax=Duganella sp. sic0402 TaxID=2854786 RepID=UPI001C496490|nr:dienelactone hydrolase family protein [Duganella sp. sic0402]MBV7534343.1 dienelactone hydrolase family protein [Duganella sp. sic0402]
MRFISLILLCCAALSAHASHYAYLNPAGKYPVGFKLIKQYDYSRSSLPLIDIDTGKPRQGELARAMQTLVWYPAAGGGTGMSYADYLGTAFTRRDFSLGDAQVALKTAQFIKQSGKALTPAQRQAEADSPVWAHRDAMPAAGKFPLVIYAPGANGQAHENAELCEYLASQGYVVLASHSVDGQGRVMNTNLEGAEAQAADIAFLIGYAHSLPQVDMGRIAVAGFSWGGLANVLAAARDQRIRALVSLDGSMRGYPEYINGGKDAAKYVTPERVNVPLLYLSARPRTIEQLEGSYDVSFSFINAMQYSDVYYYILHPMAHVNFSTSQIRFSGDADFEEYSRAEIVQAHNWASRYVLEFLNAYLKGDAGSREFLAARPVRNGVPPHMMTADIRMASKNADRPAEGRTEGAETLKPQAQ